MKLFSQKPDTLSKTLLWILDKNYKNPLWGNKIASYNYKFKTYEEIFSEAQQFQKLLLNKNINCRDIVLICCKTSEEWIIADLACSMNGIVSLPMDPQIGISNIQNICQKTNPKAILCHREQIDLLKSSNFQLVEIQIPQFSSFDSKELLMMSQEEDEKNLFTIQPTSGTTGDVKLIKKTRFSWNQRNGGKDTLMMIGSLSSPAPRNWFWTNLFYGGSFAETTLDTLIEDCQTINPTQVSAPPLVWEFISKKITSGRIQPYSTIEGNIDWLNQLFGKRCRAVTNTGAQISESTKNSMNMLFPGRFHNGYGCSEAGGISIDGKLLPGVEIKLKDVPEMGYFSTDPIPRGELLVKTTTMFDGYYEDVKKEEWFNTGDIVKLLSDNKIEIIDRISFSLKLSNGKFISPNIIENLLKSSNMVENAFVFVDQETFKVVAVIVPSWENVKKFLQVKKIENQDIIHSSDFKSKIIQELRRIQLINGCGSNELIRGLIIEPIPFLNQTNLINPSLKHSRIKMEDKYSKMFTKELNIPFEDTNHQERLLELLKNILGFFPPLESNWSELGIDSITMTQISSTLSQYFGINISVSQILHSNTIANLLENFLIGNIQEIDELSILEKDISSPLPPLHYQKFRKTGETKNLLLTGSTGFLGLHLLNQLKSFPNVNVYCLSRISKDSFDHKLTKSLGCNLKQFKHIIGDISKPYFGLKEQEYESLKEKCDLIVHNAANVDWSLSYSALRKTNTFPIRTILHFSEYSKPIHYISSIATAEPGSCEDLLQNIPDPSYGYGASKWASEVLLQRATKKYQSNVVVIQTWSFGEVKLVPKCSYERQRLSYVDSERMYLSWSIPSISRKCRMDLC
jgi:long-subunit acyl-CoA synthetase (AMP-forming)